MRLDELAALLDHDLERRLRPNRRDHSRSVADYAAFLAARNGIDPLRARVAGLAHDLCREMTLAEQRSLALGDLASPVESGGRGWPQTNLRSMDRAEETRCV